MRTHLFSHYLAPALPSPPLPCNCCGPPLLYPTTLSASNSKAWFCLVIHLPPLRTCTYLQSAYPVKVFCFVSFKINKPPSSIPLGPFLISITLRIHKHNSVFPWNIFIILKQKHIHVLANIFLSFHILLKALFLFHVYGCLPTCVSHACSAWGSPKKVSDFLDLELQTVASCHMC